MTPMKSALVLFLLLAQDRKPDVPYVPTPDEVVEAMLAAARLGEGDVLYDLGCGDGRVVIAAAKKPGVRALGVDISPERIREAKAAAERAGVAERASFREEDFFKTDLREATVVTLYLLPEVNLRLRPKLLKELRPGARIVSHAFDLGDWAPDRTIEVNGRTIYVWTVPRIP